MTTQLSDKVVFQEQNYSVAEYKGEGLFVPKAYDLQPIATSSACLRGFVAHYAVLNQELKLRHLAISFGNLDALRARLQEKPIFYGVKPIASARSPREYPGMFSYDNVNLAIPFTGNLLLGRGIVHDPCIRFRTHHTWNFKRVWELRFEQGCLLESRDRTQDIKSFREKVLQRMRNDDSTLKEFLRHNERELWEQKVFVL